MHPGLASTVIAMGRARDAGLKRLWDDYAGRLSPAPKLVELEDRKHASVAEAKKREASLLLDAVPDRAIVVALDERGKSLSSADLAARIGAWRDQGAPSAAWIIGGADGLDTSVTQRADLVLSFGTMTWPHQLVRVMLAEQLYRAATILAGHPYHRV